MPATKAIDETMMPALDEEDISGTAAPKLPLLAVGLLFGKTMLSVGACGIPGTDESTGLQMHCLAARYE
jgi:hypothetical protein